MLISEEHLLSGQPLLSGQLSFAQGWPLIGDTTFKTWLAFQEERGMGS